ncbi:uncharacterized protein LOC122620652 [Drosophila teissieri]|uniref:uncharacterized protein LOC122620652 n=1 Tax=Drosophila teissieri TaxID=7243 RepID=UPI001CBA0C52|nr:uncharacterized protein LOC122620652 [Drosophila teissieri]
MRSMESSRKKRIVPLSADLLRDIMTHGNEYQTPSGSYKEVEPVGDTRAACRSGATHSPQSPPPDTRRRTEGLADGPIVVNPPVAIAFLPRSKSKKQKPIVKEQKEEVKESLVELWVRDPPAKIVAQKVRRSFAPDRGSSEELTPSGMWTKMETRMESLENEVLELRKLLSIQTSSDQNEKPIGGGSHGLNRSQSTLSLGFKSSSDLRRTHSSSELHLRDGQSKRQLYCDMQMHLVNMIVVPKSRTSLLLNQRKELNSHLGGCLGHWRHQYSDEDWLRDFEAAVFLNRNSAEAERRSKNVRRQ